MTSFKESVNPLTPNDRYSGRIAPLTSKRCIVYIYIYIHTHTHIYIYICHIPSQSFSNWALDAGECLPSRFRHFTQWERSVLNHSLGGT